MRYTTILVPLLFVAFGFNSFQQASAEDTGIDLFEAIDQGDVTVKFIALSAKQANVLIKNESDEPVLLKLPKAIAAVPVLGQFGQNPNQNQNPGGGANQGVGGGFDMRNGQGMGNGQGFGNQQGFGMGIMRIAPGKAHKLKAKTVCLEHGKPDPKPRIAYRMIPLESFTTDPIITQVCQQLGTGQIPQEIAQAIAWHHGNSIPWTQLADLNRVKSIYRGNIKFFSPEDLANAKSAYESLSLNSEHAGYWSSMPSESSSTSAGGFAWSTASGTYSNYSDARSANRSTCR